MSNKLPNYEPVPAPTDSFDFQVFKLVWHEPPKILKFQNLHKKTFKKQDNLTFDILLKKEENDKIRDSFDVKTSENVLFYIHITDGVTITKKKDKVDCVFALDMNKLLRLSVVDVTMKNELYPYYSSFLIKENSKYFYDLSKCLISLEYKMNPPEYPNLLEEYNQLLKDDITDDNEKDYEIICKNEFNDQLYTKIKENLYENVKDNEYKFYYCYDIINKKITTINKDSKQIYQSELYLTKYYSRNKRPLDQVTQKTKIKRIIVKNFQIRENNSDMMFRFKDCFENIQYYHNLIQFGFIDNKISEPTTFKGWSYIFKYILEEGYNLQWISFRNNSLTDSSLKVLLPNVQNSKIRHVDLSHNKLNDDAMVYLNTFIEGCQNLNELDLSNNLITKNGISIITNAINKNPTLNTLNLSENDLSEIENLFEDIVSCKYLLNLYLRKCNLKYNDYKYLKKGLSRSKCKLNLLDLSYNKLTGENESYDIIKEIFKSNKSINKIYLEGMGFNPRNYSPIFEGLAQNHQIEYCHISKNPDLPFIGIINFFMRKKEMKGISILPYDKNEKKDLKSHFSYEEVRWLRVFHSKCPHIEVYDIDWAQLD